MVQKLLQTIYNPPPAEKPWRLDDLMPYWDLRYYSLGRWALAQALKAAGVSRGDVVLLPSFICRDLLASLAVIGAEPAYYPVTEGLQIALEPKKFPKAKAVLAVNYFGFPQDLAPFQEYCRATGSILIEDNAHGLFSRDKNGSWLGTRADMGVFSLRKTLPLPNGGALAIRHKETRFHAPEQPPFSSGSGLRYHLKNASRRPSGILGASGMLSTLGLFRKIRRLKNGADFPIPEPGAEKLIPLPLNPCRMLAKPLRFGDCNEETTRRRNLYSHIKQLLGNTTAVPVFPALSGGVVPYGFPFSADPRDLGDIEDRLRQEGLYSLGWPDLPDSIAPSAPAHYRTLRLVHFLW